MAPGWHARREEMRQWSHPISQWMIRKLDPQPGDTLLELAAGLGDTGLMAARRVGESGRIIITDFAPEMVAAARRRAQEVGVENAEFRTLDAERMDLEADSVDGVLCRWGYMLMIDLLGHHSWAISSNLPSITWPRSAGGERGTKDNASA
jgi:ubiquinone/menaquinone biosynthesis C-methylase UbiE